MKFTTVLSAQTLVCLGSAHTIMQAVNGNKQGVGIYMPADDSFIWDVTSNSMACNGAPVTQFRSSNVVIPVTAGQEVTGAWLHTLSSTGPDQYADNKVIDSSHKGPVTAWLKKVDDATKNPSAGPGPGWFKIAEAGLANGRWAVDDLIAAGGIQKATIPKCIEDGDYLLRFEILALHSASVLGQNQFYMECAQIRVTGGTGAAKPATVSIPGVYRQDDPGIKVMIWNNVGKPYPNSYPIPGPRPFTCPAGGPTTPPTSSAAPNPPASSAAPNPATSTMKTVTTSVIRPATTSAVRPATTSAVQPTTTAAAATTTPKPNGGSVALYGQCGGIGYSGATTCAQGTCKKSNEWYSQCLL